MKVKLTLAIFTMQLLLCTTGKSQINMPFVLNTTGGSFDNTASLIKYEWSFGELTLIDTYTSANSNLIVTQGILQPCTDNVLQASNISSFTANEWKIFPNVTTGAFELNFFLNQGGKMDLQLTDALGKVISARSFQYHCCDRIERYNISNMASGVYFINARYEAEVTNATGTTSVLKKGTFKIIKIK